MATNEELVVCGKPFAYFPFSNNLVDQYTNVFPGLTQGTTTYGDSCLSFNGATRYLMTGWGTSFYQADYSIVFWATGPSIGSNSVLQSLISHGGTTFSSVGTAFRGVATPSNPDVDKAFVMGFLGSQVLFSHYVDELTSFTGTIDPPSLYHHYVLTYTLSTKTKNVYVDGSNSGQQVGNSFQAYRGAGPDTTLGDNIWQGSQGVGSYNPYSAFEGCIRNLILYKRVLSDTEAAALFAGLPVLAPSP